MTTRSTGGVSITEAASIRSKLRLRWNINDGCWEVYTTIHGSMVFRWFKISETTKTFYQQQFNLEAEMPYVAVTGNVDSKGTMMELESYFQRNPDMRKSETPVCLHKRVKWNLNFTSGHCMDCGKGMAS